MQTMSRVKSKIADHGFENAFTRYEIVKRDGSFVVELVRKWTTHSIDHNGFAVTKTHRLVLASIYPTMDQNKPNAAPPRDIAGAVAWTKHFSTLTGIPMTVNLPN